MQEHRGRKTLVLFAIIAIVVANSYSASPVHEVTSPSGAHQQKLHAEDTLAVSVAEALSLSDFRVADQVIESQLQKDPNSVQWLFFRGMRSFLSRPLGLTKREQEASKDVFQKLQVDMERAVEIGEKRLEDDPKDSVALFYAGGACGYLGIAYASMEAFSRASRLQRRDLSIRKS